MTLTLRNFAFNSFSQFGEDGIIDRIFRTIKPESKFCVEFGASDGLYLSNTARLWLRGWKALLIECDDDAYNRLVQNTAGYDCITLNKKVDTQENSIDKIWMDNGRIPIDLMTIDVDGDDYYIFKSMKRARPRVLVCEYNPTIPNDVEVIPEQGNYMGCSILSLLQLGLEKRYALAAITDVNCIFVVQEEVDAIGHLITESEMKFPGNMTVGWFSDYDGNWFLTKKPFYGINKVSDQVLAVGNVYRPEP